MRRGAFCLLLLLPLTWRGAEPGYSLRLLGGPFVPSSPTGPGSFAQSYRAGAGGSAGLLLRFGAWSAGLQAVSARFEHQSVSGGRVDLGMGVLSVERLFALEDGAPDGPYLQLGLGWGQGALSAPVISPSSWSAAAGKLAAGYHWPFGSSYAADLEAAFWGLAGDSSRDGVLMATLALGLEFLW